ncbi:MAG TPA: hypothetical protein VF458_07515, partial [Ktedonobacteraceae bacterium]
LYEGKLLDVRKTEQKNGLQPVFLLCFPYIKKLAFIVKPPCAVRMEGFLTYIQRRPYLALFRCLE